jgi:predicted O-linked N-acetylglucosamine transferase (SPINDLY family)
MDARVTDRWVEPEGGDHDRWYTERLLRLPTPFSAWCFRPPPETLAEPVSATPALAGAPFTLASFNNWAKVGERVLDLWIRLLQALPQSRLLLAAVPEGATRERVRARVARAGIAPERLEIHGPLPPAAFRALHARADLALDPFPCNGGTTTVDTLWTGVPVLALEGEGYRSRAAAGILQAAGLDGLIAADEDGYLERAVALAADPAALDRLRRSLRDRLAASPLRDEAGHAAALAGLLREALAGVDRS